MAAPEPSMVLVGKEPDTSLEAVATTLEARLEPELMGVVPKPDTELVGIDAVLDMPLTVLEPSTALVGKVPDETLDAMPVLVEIGPELVPVLTGPVPTLETILMGIVCVLDS